MKAVHNGVCLRAHVRGALCNKGINKEEFFPAFVHRKRTVGGVAMVKKGLGKKGQIPMGNKKNKNKYHNL